MTNVAQSYAKAVFELHQEQVNESFIAALKAFDGLLKDSKPLKGVLLGPATSSSKRQKITHDVAEALGFEKPVTHFLELLAKRGRLGLLENIEKQLKKIQCEASGGVLGDLVSASPLDGAEVENLKAAFGTKAGKTVEFEVKVDPSLLAGVKVTLEGVTYDGTLRSKLRELREVFVNAPIQQKVFNGNNGLGTA